MHMRSVVRDGDDLILKPHQSHFGAVAGRGPGQILCPVAGAGAQSDGCAFGFGAVFFGAVLVFLVLDEFLPSASYQ